MMNTRVAWYLVITGMYVKLIAFGLIVALPVIIPYTTGWSWTALYFVPALLSLDFFGRCLCTAAPISSRRFIFASIAAQALAIALAYYLPFAFPPPPAPNSQQLFAHWQRVVPLFLFGIFYSQTLSAALFTSFLHYASRALGRPDLEDRLKSLSRSVGITTVTGTFLLPLLVGLAAAVFWVILGLPYLYIISFPLAALLGLLAIPIVWIITIPAFMTAIQYTRALMEVRRAILCHGATRLPQAEASELSLNDQ